MPTDPPMLRDRLSSAAAVVRMRGASVSNARLCSGTKIRPRPRPWTTPLMITGRDGWSSAKPVIIHSDTPISATPMPTSSRASILPVSRPASSIEISVPTPRGAVRKPDCSTE